MSVGRATGTVDRPVESSAVSPAGARRAGGAAPAAGAGHGVSRRRLLAGAAGGALLAACGQGTQQGTQQAAPSTVAVKFEQPVELSFFHTQTGSNANALQAMVDKFNATNDKRITVKAEHQGSYSQLHEKNMAALSGGTPPEVSVAYENFVAEYMRGNGNVDLDEYVRDKTLGLSKQSLDDIFPTYLEGLRFSQYGNKLLSFPFTKSLVVMYVNEDLLERANVKSIPKTWAEFAAAIQATTRTDASYIVDAQLGAATDPSRTKTYGWGNYASASTINAWAYSRGGAMLTPDNKQVRFGETPYLEAFQLTEDAFKRQQAYNPPRQPGIEFDFTSNRMAFIMQSSTGRPFLRRTIKDNGREAMRWSVVGIPQKDPAKPATVQYGANVAVFRTTPIKQAASWAFVKWFTERDQDVEWSITSSYMPIRKSSAEHPRLKAHWESVDPQGKQAFDQSKYGRPEPNIRGTEPIRPVIQKALMEVMQGTVSSKAALEQATKEANLLLEQAR